MKRLLVALSLIFVLAALMSCATKRNQKPVIKGIKNEEEITVVLGSEWDPLDILTAEDEEDGDLTSEIKITGEYNLNQQGRYTITASVKDSKGLEAKIIFYLIVTDESGNNPPTLDIKFHVIEYYIGEGEIDIIKKAGITAFDIEDKDLTDKVTISDNYDLETIGTYEIEVKVVDNDGAVASQTITLVVKGRGLPEELTSEPITITFWHAFGKEKEDYLKKYAEDFMAMYPNITIEMASQGGYNDLRSKVGTSIIAGNQPTMTIAYPDHVVSYLQADAVENLDEYISHPKYGTDLDDYIEAYVNENRSYDKTGRLYGLPFNKSTEVMIYNKTFFDENDLQVPTTWEEVEAIARIVKEKYTKEDEFGFAYDSAANMFITLTRQWGGKYTDIDQNGNGLLLFDNPQTKAMLKYFTDLQSENLVTLPSSWQQDYASEPFKNQKVFMTVGSTAGITHNIPSDNAFELGVAPIPQKDPNNKYVIQQGTNIIIMKKASPQEKLAAWLFTKYLTGKEVTTDWAIKTGYLPVRYSAVNSQEYQDFLDYENETDLKKKYTAMCAVAAFQQQGYMFVDQPFIGSSRVRDQVDALIIRVVVGKADIQKAIDDALAELNDIVN